MSGEQVASANDPLRSAVSTEAAPPVPRRLQFAPGSRAFTLTLSGAMAMTALAIDSLLPAFDNIRDKFGLAPDATNVAALVTAFMVGGGVGQIPAGLLADRFGRLTVLRAGVALYVAGAVAAALAPTLWMMVLARFVWGIGSAGPRVAVTAMVRDAYKGAAMAKQMSTIMAIFLVVPMIAPSIGAGLIAIGPWQLTIWLCVALAVLILLLSQGLPSTMPAGGPKSLSLPTVFRSWKDVLLTRGTMAYMFVTVVSTGSFMSYIASSENIIDETFGLKSWFAVIFGAGGAVLAIANVINGRIVMRMGLRRMLRALPATQFVTSSALLVTALATGGRPPFALFLVLLLATMMVQQVTNVNANSAAMLPLGHVAGSAAAIIGSLPQVLGAMIGSQVDARFDGTITPLAFAFVGSAVLGNLAIMHALRVTQHDD